MARFLYGRSLIRHGALTAAVACCLLISAVSRAAPASERIWSQERVVMGPGGSAMPQLLVRADELDGLAAYDCVLSTGATLHVETNLAAPFKRGLDDLASAVAAAWHFTRSRLAITPRGDILLYLIEADAIPASYRFEARGTLDSRFGEVRLAWIPLGASLWGESMPVELAELVFDTLPHEFVHDQLDQLPMLRQELSRGPNPGTRWFVEGLCEMIAKEFSRTTDPSTWARTIHMRRLDHASALLGTRDALIGWSQTSASAQHESDLYGASMLVLRLWSAKSDPRSVLERIKTAEQAVSGRELLAWMLEDLGQPDLQLDAFARVEASRILAELRSQETRASLGEDTPAR